MRFISFILFIVFGIITCCLGSWTIDLFESGHCILGFWLLIITLCFGRLDIKCLTAVIW